MNRDSYAYRKWHIWSYWAIDSWQMERSEGDLHSAGSNHRTVRSDWDKHVFWWCEHCYFYWFYQIKRHVAPWTALRSSCLPIEVSFAHVVARVAKVGRCIGYNDATRLTQATLVPKRQPSALLRLPQTSYGWSSDTTYQDTFFFFWFSVLWALCFACSVSSSSYSAAPSLDWYVRDWYVRA